MHKLTYHLVDFFLLRLLTHHRCHFDKWIARLRFLFFFSIRYPQSWNRQSSLHYPWYWAFHRCLTWADSPRYCVDLRKTCEWWYNRVWHAYQYTHGFSILRFAHFPNPNRYIFARLLQRSNLRCTRESLTCDGRSEEIFPAHWVWEA